MHGKEFEPPFQYCPPEMVDAATMSGTQSCTWQNTEQSGAFEPLHGNLGSNIYSRDAKIIRQNFRDFL